MVDLSVAPCSTLGKRQKPGDPLAKPMEEA